MVRSPALTAEDIEENIRTGNIYASTGIRLTDYQVTKRSIAIDSENGESIAFIGVNGSVLDKVSGKSAKYKFKGDELYVRAKITNSDGKAAWTQPVFVN